MTRPVLLALIFSHLLVPALLRGDEAAQRKIRVARSDGSRFLTGSLRSLDKPSPLLAQYPLGCRALSAWAMLEGGERHKAGAVTRLYQDMEQYPLTRVYSAATYIQALDARWRVALASDGDDEYLRRQQEETRQKISEIAAWLRDALVRGSGLWGYYPQTDRVRLRRVDLSNTTMAMHALQVARRHGFVLSHEITYEIVQGMLGASRTPTDETDARPKRIPLVGNGWWSERDRPDRFQASLPDRKLRNPPIFQMEAGSFQVRHGPVHWPYEISLDQNSVVDESRSGTMTAAAISVLLILRDWLPPDDLETRYAIDRHVAGGLVAIEAWGLDLITGAGERQLHSYPHSLLMFDCAQQLAGVQRLGRDSGFAAHARRLVDRQSADGAWNREGLLDPEMTRVHSAFAVLFLSRAGQQMKTHPSGWQVVGIGDTTRGPSGSVASRDWVFLRSRNRTYSVTGVFSAIALGSGDTELCEEVMASVRATQALAFLDALIALTDSGTTSVQQFAREQLGRITGLAHDATAEQLRAWQESWQQTTRPDRADIKEQCAELSEYLLVSPASADILKRAAIEHLVQLRTLDSAPPLLKALADPAPSVRQSAHEGFCELLSVKLQFRNLGNPVERANDIEALENYWRKNEDDLRFDIAWRHLHKELERCRDDRLRMALRKRISALGSRALPEIESILDRESFSFDWLLVWEMITGEKRGI